MALDVDGTYVSDIWFRHVPAGSDVFWQAPHPPDNRWQRGEVVDALYFADSDATMWAEWYRFLADAGVRPDAELPRDTWRWELSLAKLADLRTEEQLARVGLHMPTPNRAEWPRFSAVGEQLWRQGWQGVIAPSAAREDGFAICAFRDEAVVPGTTPLPPPETVDRAPVVPKGLRT